MFWIYDLQRFMGTRDLGVLFDVGANRGQTLQHLLKYAPRAEIHSFEPTDEVFNALAAKFGGRTNIRLHKLALGSRAETLRMLTRDNSELNTLVGAATAESALTQNTELATVDSIVAQQGISHLDLLKIDVQGWEVEVIRGAEQVIRDHNLIFVLAEAAFRSEETEMQQFSELHSCLTAQGFILSGMYDWLCYGPRREFALFANVLYLHPHARLKWVDMREEWDGWMATHPPGHHVKKMAR
jgi:FkbM family methyltransferase